jgi:putative transposase
MPRLARAVIPGVPHHITQRGNRRQRTFFEEEDHARYLELMSEWCARCSVEVWAWCLMPNHVHLVAVPDSAEGLRRAIGEAHRRYTLAVNQREGWQGHLWQGRFRSFVMDERHTLAAARYVELNPVRAGLVSNAADYPWSSARAHLRQRDDGLVRVQPLLDRVPDWDNFLSSGPQPEVEIDLRKHQTTGRPLGSDEFVEEMEQRIGRSLRPAKPGRPRRAAAVGFETGPRKSVWCPQIKASAR